MAFIKHWEPSIRILTCDRVSEGKKVSTADWCVRNGYELIELHPDDESVAEAVDYGEEIGLSRLVQVLKAHSWSNLELSDEKDLAQAERLRGFLSAEEDTTDRDDGDFGDFQSAQIEAAADTVVLKENPVECGFSDNFSDHKAVRHCAGYAKLLAEKSEPSKDTDARPQSVLNR